MRIVCKEKYGAEWAAVRRQRITSSGVTAALSTPGTQLRTDYHTQLLADLEEIPDHLDEYPDPWIKAAREMRQCGILWYGNHIKQDIVQTGFVIHSDCDWIGFTPHGFVQPQGLLHVQCRKSLGAMRANSKCSAGRMKRIQFELLCSGRQWCDYVNYWADGTEEKATIQRIPFDAALADFIEYGCHLFWKQVLKQHLTGRKTK